MIKLNITDRAGATHQIESGEGNLMQAIVDAGFESIFGICGGACSCASCHVILGENAFNLTGPAGSDEAGILDSSEFRTPTSRLACQIRLAYALHGLSATIAPEG